MDILPSDLGASASAARDRLAVISRQAALAGSGPTQAANGGAMAGAAREAIFADAPARGDARSLRRIQDRGGRPMSEFDILGSAAAGMDAQRATLDLAARNVAASQADGASFARLVPRYALAASPGGADGGGDYEPPEQPDEAGDDVDRSGGTQPIRYVGATAQRGVAPDTLTEMVAVLDAQRAYDADASVFDLGKRLAERTIDMGRVS